eukprot:GGOE01014357.1.p3 GENE.GGOE01014357.1~~GGOE01014357.1.p3  ORF type:complete len:134 (+),score=27.50 GGOE01014357.1:41-403(+)
MGDEAAAPASRREALRLFFLCLNRVGNPQLPEEVLRIVHRCLPLRPKQRALLGCKKHRPYFTTCSDAWCNRRDFCRRCAWCHTWVCNSCQSFLKRGENGGWRYDNTVPGCLCHDCQWNGR